MGLTLVLGASRGPSQEKDETSPDDWAPGGAESGPRGAAGAAGTGRAMKEDGRGSGEEEGKSKEVEVADAGRIGVVREDAISES